MSVSVKKDDEITLNIGQRTFTCLKSDLIARSEYFLVMFSHGFAEKNQDSITLKDVDETAFEFIIERKSLENCRNFDSVFNILRVSTMLQFDEVAEKCEHFIMDKCFYVKPLKVMITSFELDQRRLFTKSSAYCLWNYSDLIDDDDFVCIPLNLLASYMDDDGLHASKGEMEVFKGVERWMDENPIEEEDAVKIMETIRYCALSLDLLENILTSRFITKVDKLKNLVQNLIEYKKCNHILKCSDCHIVSSTNCDSDIFCALCVEKQEYVAKLLNKPPRKRYAMPCFTTHNFTFKENNRMFPTVFGYNGEKIIKVLTLNERPSSDIFIGFKIISKGFKMFIFGGEHGYGKGLFNMGIWSYDFITEKWNYESDISEQRRHFAAAVLDNWVYLVGGTGKYRKVLRTIDRYDLVTKKWSNCTTLPYCSSTVPALCTHNNKIYILHYKTLYSYDPFENIFNAIPIEVEITAAFDFICIHNNYLYGIEKGCAQIYRWLIFNNTVGKCPTENLGKFSGMGVSLLVEDSIYHFSYKSESFFFAERLCLNTFKIEEVFSYPYKFDFRVNEILFYDSFILPCYF